MLKKSPVITAIAAGGLIFLIVLALNKLFQEHDDSHLFNGPFQLAPGLHTDDVRWLPFSADTVFVVKADYMTYPYNCVADAWGNLYVLDWKLKEIHKFDPSGKYVKRFGGFGSGPGEFGGNGSMYITPNRRIIYVNDHKNSRLVLYDTSGTHIKAITGLPFSWDRVMTLDERVIGFRLYKKPIGRVYSNKGEPLLDFGEHVTASQLVNQGFLWMDRDEQVYFANYYTSVIQVYRPNGEFVYKIDGPIKVLPEKAINNKNFQLTFYEPNGTLDMCTADDFLYVLFSGKLNSMELDIDSNFSKLVHIYKRQTGEYLGSIELPGLTNAFHVYQNRIFVIQHGKESSWVVAYDLSKTLAALQQEEGNANMTSSGKRRP